MPQFKPYDLGGTLEQANRIAGGQTDNQTRLLELADLKAKQQAEQEFLLAVQNNPALAQQLLGGSVIGSLDQPAGPPGGALTQQAFGPGGAPGPAQAVPGGQSTIASLGPAGQAQAAMQGPQNPALAMAAQNPRAALMMQQQIEGRQDRQWKMQEQQLSMGVKVAEFVARELQGVTDQASLDQARERIRQVHPQAATQVPQMYSKEGVASVQQRGVAIADRAQNAYHEAKARNLDMETQMFPELAKRLGLGGDVQEPATGAPAPPTTTPTPGHQARTAPREYESAITEANRLFPQVSTTRIKSIIAAESNFDAKAVSSAGAKGLMQLMDATAKDMGVDDPFDINQNVRGGTRYYAQMLTRYGGDERKALAAYNWGPGNLDKVSGDVSKAPAETQAYVNRVLGGGGGGATGTAQTAPTDPRIAQLDTKIAQRTRDAQIASLMKNESLSTRLEDEAKRLRDERTRLLDESRRQQERAEEIPRAVERQAALEPGELRQARAGAEVQREAKQYEPIGIQAADELDLPASTLWKDVPKDRKPMPRPGEGERKALSDLRASVSGVDSLLTKLDDPKIAGMIGTIFTEPEGTVARRLSTLLSTLSPEQRAFAATIAGEIMEIRHRLIGAGQTGIEVSALAPMMPSPEDTDPATVRAKLTALRDGMLRRHEAKRGDLAGLGFRVPEKLAQTAVPAAPKTSSVVDKFKAIKP